MRICTTALCAVFFCGCLSTRQDLRTHDFKVVTNPPGAEVKLRDETGERMIGASPAAGQSRYQVEVHDFNEWSWIAPVVLGVVTAASWSSFEDSISKGGTGDSATPTIVSGTIGGVATTAFLTSLFMNVMMQGLNGQETGSVSHSWDGNMALFRSGVYSTMEVTASKDGFLPASHRIALPSEHKEIHLILKPVKGKRQTEGKQQESHGNPETP